MKTAGRAILLLVLLLIAGYGSAQAQARVRGRVVAADTRAPMPGATVHAKGTSAGVLTNENGEYNLQVPAGADTLVVASIGYRTQNIVIAGRPVINVALETLPVSLDAIVAVGYTSESRRNISGAVAALTTKSVSDRQTATLEEALRAKVAGVNIVSSGEPGRASQVVIRGQSFIGNVSPLYVVDGMYMRQNPNLNPDEVESIQVLKDASAASQYGAQAANGVIVIKTKRGRLGDNKVSLRSYYGFQEIAKTVDMADAREWARINTMARTNAGMQPFASAINPQFDTDWQDAILQKGAIQDHNLTFSGGSDNASYLLTGGFLKQDGTIIETGFERYSMRVNSELRRGRLTLGENVGLSRSLRDNLSGYPLIDAMRMQPTIPVYDPDNASGYGYGSDANPTFGTNPVGAIERQENKDAVNSVLGTAYAEIALPRNFRYRFNLGLNYQDVNWRLYELSRQVRQNTVPEATSLTDRRDNTQSLLFENLLSFEDKFGAHEINAVAGYTEQKETFNRLQAFRRGFPDETLSQIDAGTSQFGNAGYKVENALRSFLVRANYVYGGRYLFTGSFRRDGSSRFGPSNRYGNFVSGSLGWIVSAEDFYRDIPFLGSAVEYLKLRGSRGTLGNQDIGDYQYAASIVANQSYPFGADQVSVGQTQLSLANPSIKWQDNTQTNIGFDMNLMDSNLTITADYYVSESGGLLVRAPLPWSLGSLDAPYVNAGSVKNTGFELGATYHAELGEVRMDFNGNVTTIDNEVTELGNGGQPLYAGTFGVARTMVGAPIGTFFVRKTNGIFQSEAEVAAHKAQPNAKPGDIRYVDLNGDNLINDEDRYEAGSGIPDFEGGLSFDATWRRLDFSMGLRGSYGAEIFNVAKYWSDRMDENSNYRRGIEPWTPENRSTTTPRAVFGTAGAENKWEASDRWIEDGDYLKIQKLTLGYAVPESVAERFGLTTGHVRVYLAVQNLVTLTGYSNWDPEVLGFNDPLARGIDDGRIYPNPRTFTFGVDLDL